MHCHMLCTFIYIWMVIVWPQCPLQCMCVWGEWARLHTRMCVCMLIWFFWRRHRTRNADQGSRHMPYPGKAPNTCKTKCDSRATSVKCPLRHSINESWKDPLGPPVVILAYVSFPQALTTSIVSSCEKSSVRTRPKSAFDVWEKCVSR